MIRLTLTSGASKLILLYIGVFWPPCAILFWCAEDFSLIFMRPTFKNLSEIEDETFLTLLIKKLWFFFVSEHDYSYDVGF